MGNPYPGYVSPLYFMTEREYIKTTDMINGFSKMFSSDPTDIYYNRNIQEVMYENSDDLEFGGYNPLCDSAIYYFIENVSEFEEDLEDDEEEEYLEDDYEEDDDYDVTDEDGLDFWLFCDKIGIRLKPIDCLQED